MNSEKKKDLERTVSENRSRLLSFIRQRVGFDEEAEDILQDVLFQFFISYETIESFEKISAWMFQVARNRIIDRYRRQKHADWESLSDEDDDPRSVALMGLIDEPKLYFNATITESLVDALDQLPDEQREVFVMHEIEGVSFNQISKLTGVGVNTLLSRKRYAVKHLRQELQHLYDELRDT